jgi:5S rRNA maturation endonuclease (ribonuclease M5)
MTATAYERLLDRLDRVKGNGTKATALCPVHEADGQKHNPSLSITRIEGQVLVHCHTGCHIDDVLAALGLTRRDLYDEPKGATYTYDDGRIVHRTPDKEFPQSGNKNGQPTLYRLTKVNEAVRNGETILLVEGEKDVHALESVGVTATTAPMGAANLGKCDLTPLHGAELIAIVDNDEKGEKVWAPQVLAKLDGKAKSLDFAKSKVGKDISDHIAAGYTLAEIIPWYPPEPEKTEQKKGRFTVRTFADIQRRTSTWLVDGVLPDDDLTVFIGEEGIGKGLFSADVIARVTKAGHNVLIIATEDDFERVLGPRLDVAGADPSRCITMLTDPDTMQGQPHLPHDIPEVEAVITQYNVRFVYIDPWVSSISGGLRLQNTQEARLAIDPLVSLARRTHSSILAVAHPNRGEGDLRARVGLSAVLRQAARLLLFALEPPDDDTKLVIGIEKANETGRAPATIYRKVPKKHPTLPNKVWAVEEIADAPRLTIRQWHDQYRTDRDHRTTDRWVQVLAAAKDGLVQRADIIAIYEDSGSNQGAADKAINRWLASGRLVRSEGGVYELASD